MSKIKDLLINVAIVLLLSIGAVMAPAEEKHEAHKAQHINQTTK